jgi:hypothetical protein
MSNLLLPLQLLLLLPLLPLLVPMLLLLVLLLLHLLHLLLLLLLMACCLHTSTHQLQHCSPGNSAAAGIPQG